MTGFKMSWHIQNSNGTRWNPKVANTDDTTAKIMKEMTDLASFQKTKPPKDTYPKQKSASLDANMKWYKTLCKVGQHITADTPMRQDGVETDLFSKMALTTQWPPSANSNANHSEEAIHQGFSLVSDLLYCSVEGIKIYQFYNKTLKTESLPTILQATINNLVRNRLSSYITLKSVARFYSFLEKQYDLQLGRVLVGLSTREELAVLMDRGLPFLTRWRVCWELYDCCMLRWRALVCAV